MDDTLTSPPRPPTTGSLSTLWAVLNEEDGSTYSPPQRLSHGNTMSTPPLTPEKHGRSPTLALRVRDANTMQTNLASPHKRSPLKSRQLFSAATEPLLNMMRSPDKFPRLHVDKENTSTQGRVVSKPSAGDISLNLFSPIRGKHSVDPNKLVDVQSPSKPQPLRHTFVSPRKEPQLGHTVRDDSISKPTPQAAIPQFYFPKGNQKTLEANNARRREQLVNVRHLFVPKLTLDNFHIVCNEINLPRCFAKTLFDAVMGQDMTTDSMTFSQFSEFWTAFSGKFTDPDSQAYALLVGEAGGPIEAVHLQPIVTEIVLTHPGLSFLQNSYQFQTKYIESIIVRIFYAVDRGRTGRLALKDWKKSCVMDAIRRVEATDDINTVMDFFSYKHFYVLFCRFWELDKDHDGLIGKLELLQFDDGALSTRLVDRIVKGHGRLDKDTSCLSGTSTVRARAALGQMNFEDFIWFLLSEEDKTSVTAIEYWFRCLDMDDDSILSMYEIEFFMEEQVLRLHQLKMDPLQFQDSLCQMLDMINPRSPHYISVSDIQRCGLSSVLYNALFNVDKFIAHEGKSPSQIKLERERPPMSDWNRYAEDEYEYMAAQEASQQAAAQRQREGAQNNVDRTTTLFRTNSMDFIDSPSDSDDDDFDEGQAAVDLDTTLMF